MTDCMTVIQIWSNPELGYQEHIAHDTICDFLEKQGFSVTRHAYGIPTAFEAQSGHGGRLVCFNAEYDALPNIGHACGHNLIATAGVAGFLALSHILRARNNGPGRTRLLGTPAEEGGGGKIKLLQAGAYEGVDVTLMAYVLDPLSGHEAQRLTCNTQAWRDQQSTQLWSAT